MASDQVAQLKRSVEQGKAVQRIRADRATLLVDDSEVSEFGGESVLFSDFLGAFDLMATIDELGQSRLWGPDLITPSDFSYISPWVLGGDPCVEETRIPTATIYALREERGLDADDIVDLYPGLGHAQAEDAYRLERRLHGLEAAA